jgi:hypothetical protein
MTTLREAALAALALVNDTLLERTVDTKRLSAVGRDLEDALDAEPAQPVAWRSWTGQCGYGYWESQTDADLHSDPDYRPVPLYTAPPAPADVPVYPNCPHAHECVDGGRYGKGAYEDLMNNAMGGKPWGECLCGIGDDGKPKVGDHFYTADAIREAVERERQEIILVLKDELFSEEEVLFVKGYNGGIRNALEVIKARGAA